jgi:hypothetical protein
MREDARASLERLARFIVRVHRRRRFSNPQVKIRAIEDSTVESESLSHEL